MNDWPGLEIQLERDTGNIITRALDARETETPPINSASGYYIVSNSVNLYDGNWHNVLYMWANNCFDDFPSYENSEAASIIQKGLVVVDGIIIANTIPTAGKSTPFNFIHNDINKLATFISIGARAVGAGSTSYSSFDQVIQPYAGMIQKMVIWDRVLGADYSTNIDTSYNAYPDYSDSIIRKMSQNFGTSNNWDPLTGSNAASTSNLSSNIVAYYKFDEMAETSTSATDWAGAEAGGTNLSAKGQQIKPLTGNPINWYGAEIDMGDYQLQDISNFNEDGIMKTGHIAFEDNYGIKRPVGFINYDLGFVVLDGEFCESGGVTGIPFLQSIGSSGMTTTLSTSANNFYVKKINFTSQEFVESVVLNISINGPEMNITENPTGIDQTTGRQLYERSANPNSTWPTSIGLYNDFNELIGIAKFNQPIRKDEDHDVNAQVKLDFSGSYPKGAAIQP